MNETFFQKTKKKMKSSREPDLVIFLKKRKKKKKDFAHYFRIILSHSHVVVIPAPDQQMSLAYVFISCPRQFSASHLHKNHLK